MSRRDEYNPTAIEMFFDNIGSTFNSENVEDAIKESAALGSLASRGPTTCSFDGTASTGRWLEFSANNPSNTVPFILAEDCELISLSIVTSATSATGNARVFRNGIGVQNISLTAQKKNAISGLSITLNSLDELSVQITSGSITRATVYLFIRTLP